MKLLIDNALSPRLAAELRSSGLDAVHVRDLDLAAATDAVILARSVAEERTLVSRDGDFAALLANGGASLPSLVHLRTPLLNRPDEQAAVLLRVLAMTAEELASGAIVTVRGPRGERIRARRLPVR